MAILVYNGRDGIRTLEFNRGNRGFIVNRNAHFFYCVGQRLIEITPWYLPGPLPSLCELICKLIVAGLSVFYKLGSAFFLKILFLHSIQETGFFQRFHAP